MSPSPLSEPRHLLVANAALPPSSLPLPPLPHLATVLALARVERVTEVDDENPATAHELALAHAHGLPGEPGRVAWAAFASGIRGTPCAWLTPAHLQTGLDTVELSAHGPLRLSEADSRALLAACAPLLADDSLAASHAAPGLWLAQGELLDKLRTVSPERAAGRRLTRGQLARADDAAQQRRLARLQSELEMLLASHPLNHAREAAGLPPVNALWLHGAGALPASWTPAPGVLVAAQLTELPPGDAAADPTAHAAAWNRIDAELAAPLAAALRAGTPVRLTLSGPRRAITLRAERGAWPRLRGKMLRLSLPELLPTL